VSPERQTLTQVANLLADRLEHLVGTGKIARREADLLANRAADHIAGIAKVLDQVDQVEAGIPGLADR